jgi:hypothetical protein
VPERRCSAVREAGFAIRVIDRDVLGFLKTQKPSVISATRRRYRAATTKVIE